MHISVSFIFSIKFSYPVPSSSVVICSLHCSDWNSHDNRLCVLSYCSFCTSFCSSCTYVHEREREREREREERIWTYTVCEICKHTVGLQMEPYAIIRLPNVIYQQISSRLNFDDPLPLQPSVYSEKNSNNSCLCVSYCCSHVQSTVDCV